jgi:xanthine dehydrogenase YagR molybdenum-binding subunit
MAAIGEPLWRVDGRAKVTGGARYSAEFHVPNLVHAVMVLSTIPSGTVAAIDTSEARSRPGVLTVLTHENAPRVQQHKSPAAQTDRNLAILQDAFVRYDRQPVAVVVADTFERATDAASLVKVRYTRDRAVTAIERGDAFTPHNVQHDPAVIVRGMPEEALADAAIRVDKTYSTPVEHHNPMEPHATIAQWNGEMLTLHDATQGVFGTRKRMAEIFGLPISSVRVICPFVGGGFGSKGSVWPHTALAAMAAKAVGRPVKLVLTRPQMFGSVGYRPRTIQRVALGASRDGKVVSTIHTATTQTSVFDDFVEPSTMLTKMLYDVPNLRVAQTLVRVNASTPTFTRAPGESSGSFALESAMDELAYAAGLDPLELRLRNYAENDPGLKVPFSSKSLRECYRIAAKRFGWEKRSPQPRSMRTGDLLVGYGMATATYPTNSSPAAALVRVAADGSVLAQAGTQDLGTGSYTIFTQVAADGLGVPVERVRFQLGDTNMPMTPVSGGSQTAASVGPAVYAAAKDARRKVLAFALADSVSPLYGASPDDVIVSDGRFALASDPQRGETYAEILARHPSGEIEGRDDNTPDPAEKKAYSMHAFGAQFAEVHVDPDFGTVRVVRMTSAFASGKILNRKTAHSQYIGGMVWSIGMALHEVTRTDLRTGRIMSANLADYLVPVNADVPNLEAIIVDEEDAHVNSLGVKGIGEIGIVGGAAAIANAVYHATGKRIRDLPIQPDKLVDA